MQWGPWAAHRLRQRQPGHPGRLAGHANIETTLGYYIHTDDAYDDQVRSAGLGRPEQDTTRTHVADSAAVEAA